MEKINLNIKNYKENRFGTAIALGNFDGMHIGHQKIINNTVKDSDRLKLNPSVLLFDNHTKLILKGKEPEIITSKGQKDKLLKELGIKTIYSIRFDKELMKLSPEDFVKDILLGRLNAKSICVGFDYRFGHKASGNVETLKKLGNIYDFNVTIIDPVYKDNIISSTKIRDSIRTGKIEDANNMLGRNYSIIGKVVDGHKMGHKLGFPTANLDTEINYVIPKLGIYESRVILDGKTYIGATSIGINPTFERNILRIENHILDFNEDIYGKELEIEFVRFIRDEIKFDNIEDLKKQISEDVNNIKSKNPNVYIREEI